MIDTHVFLEPPIRLRRWLECVHFASGPHGLACEDCVETYIRPDVEDGIAVHQVFEEELSLGDLESPGKNQLTECAVPIESQP